MKILLPEEIKQPKGRLLFEEQKLGDEIFNLGTLPLLNPGRDWSTFCKDFDSQRLADGEDPDDCTIASSQNRIYSLHLLKFGVDLPKKSRRWTALKSGNVQDEGNSFSAVDRSIIGDGMVDETDCPSGPPTITNLDQFYADLDPAINAKENFKGIYDYSSFPVPDIHSGLGISEVRAAVKGRYNFNSLGEVISVSNASYNHAIVISSEPSPNENYYLVQDSENPSGFVKFSPDYPFQSLSACTLEKKNMIQLVKQIGNPAIYFINPSDGLSVSFSDGIISGGDMFKMMFGDYKFAPIKRLNDSDWTAHLAAHPIANYVMTTVLTQSSLSAIAPEDAVN